MSEPDPPPAPEPVLDLSADGAHTYVVDLTTTDGAHHNHRVTVDDRLLDELDLVAPDEPTLVRAALELVASRPGPTMPPEFSLADVESAYPGTLAELRTALGR